MLRFPVFEVPERLPQSDEIVFDEAELPYSGVFFVLADLGGGLEIVLAPAHQWLLEKQHAPEQCSTNWQDMVAPCPENGRVEVAELGDDPLSNAKAAPSTCSTHPWSASCARLSHPDAAFSRGINCLTKLSSLSISMAFEDTRRASVESRT